MKVKSILAEKGSFVATISPDATVTELCALLTEHNIGAAVVSPDGSEVVGIASERDVVRAIAAKGREILDAPVSDLMTGVVAVCEPSNSTDDLMMTMTERRIRHVPVLEEESLSGIISIGDVVRVTVAELQEEKATLLGYITS
ncbi:MAG: CBS domain-containing protein [Actinobacteria bacterium]|nr:CBS domain-containing protein [Actinomycetota bacterium]MCB9413260.1 CBS domain-containing protein [Actinomycetota bacterium]